MPARREFLRTAVSGLAALAVLATPVLAAAAEAEVSAVLGRTKITLGESVYLQVEVSTDSGSIAAPSFAKLENVEVNARGTSTGVSMQMGPGGATRRATKTFTYVLS